MTPEQRDRRIQHAKAIGDRAAVAILEGGRRYPPMDPLAEYRVLAVQLRERAA